jgi:hypothetical protein
MAASVDLLGPAHCVPINAIMLPGFIFTRDGLPAVLGRDFFIVKWRLRRDLLSSLPRRSIFNGRGLHMPVQRRPCGWCGATFNATEHCVTHNVGSTQRLCHYHCIRDWWWWRWWELNFWHHLLGCCRIGGWGRDIIQWCFPRKAGTNILRYGWCGRYDRW